MIWWILNDGSYDYHNSSGPDFNNDEFVKTLITKGNCSVWVCIYVCKCVRVWHVCVV